MPKEKQKSVEIAEIDETAREHKFRHSLQPKPSSQENTSLRHTQSQIYGEKRKRVKTQAPRINQIPEVEDGESDHGVGGSTGVVLEVPKQQVRRKSSHSRGGVENGAFEDDAGRVSSKGNSAPNSIRSSLRDSSVRSLSVVREQYCCCSRWTPCERALFATVGVLIFIIVILIITVALVASNNSSSSDNKSFLHTLLQM